MSDTREDFKAATEAVLEKRRRSTGGIIFPNAQMAEEFAKHQRMRIEYDKGEQVFRMVEEET